MQAAVPINSAVRLLGLYDAPYTLLSVDGHRPVCTCSIRFVQ